MLEVARKTVNNSLPEEFWILIGFLMFILIGIVLIISIITMIGQWQVFKKAGKPGWVAIIPFYNNWCLYEIMGLNPLLCLFTIVGSFMVGVGNTLNFYGQTGNHSFIILLGLLFNLVSIGLNITGLVFNIKGSLQLSKYFGKSDAYGIGLAFLPFVFYPMLGFDKKAKYKKK